MLCGRPTDGSRSRPLFCFGTILCDVVDNAQRLLFPLRGAFYLLTAYDLGYYVAGASLLNLEALMMLLISTVIA